MKLRELAERLGCELLGDGELEVSGAGSLEDAGPRDLTFLANPRYGHLVASVRAAAIVVPAGQQAPVPRLVSDNPSLTFARAVALLHPGPPGEPGVHPSAVVHPTAVLGADVSIRAFAVVGARTRIGARTVVHPHVVVGEDVSIGEDCLLHSGVHVGDRVVVQNGAVIGADGFGFARDRDGRYHKFPQIGIVVVEDDVEIGALTAVDRAALGETRIGRGTKLDNLVQVGHSVTVGTDSVLCAQVGIGGSTQIGKQVTLAGQVGVADHATVGDGVIATAQTGIPSVVEPGKLVSGYPAIENRSWLKASAIFARLPEVQKRLRELERKLESLLASAAVPR